MGSSDAQQSGTGEGTATTEIQSPQPPASNPGADNPTGGISEGAGGLSSTAHIESPVPNQETGLLSTVKNMFGLGKTEEIKAEDKGPAEDATTAPSTSLLAGGAATAGAGVAAVGLGSSSTGAAGTTQTTSTSSDLPSGSQGGTYLNYQQAGNTETPAFPSSQTLPIRSTPGGQLPSESSSSTKTDTTTKATESTTDRTTSSTTDNDNSSDKMTEESGDKERTEPKTHKPPQPADGKPSGRVGMENVDAIPTAGGKRLGEENWGESKIVPDDPKPKSDDKGISSEAGQPTGKSYIHNN